MRKLFIFLFAIALFAYADAPWIPNVRVSTDQPWDTLDQGESWMAVYGDTIVAICNTAQRGSVPIAPYAYSFNSGTSFTSIPFTDTVAGIIWHTDPLIAFDDSGYVHMIIQFSSNRLKHYLSRDGGQTWHDTSTVWSTYGVDKPVMVVNNNEIYITWQQTSGSVGIYLAKSTDYGQTWTASNIWSRTGITALAMDENEILHLHLVHWGAGNIYYRRSTDKGVTWSSETFLSTFTYDPLYGDRAPINSLTVHGDILFSTWVSGTNGTWDVFGMRSTDAGDTWLPRFVINDIATGGQCKGYAHFDQYGGLHVMYYHTPDYPPNANSLYEVRYQFSPDSGATFNPSIRMCDTTCRSLNDFLGEYHVCDSDDQFLYAIWTDGRNGDDNDLYFSKALLSDLQCTEHLIAEPRVGRLLNAPSVFSQDTYIEIMPCQGPVRLSIFDVNGRMVTTLYTGMVPNRTRLSLPAADLPHGVLFMRLDGQGINETAKMIHVN
jgi:hypothetical protein